MIATSHVIIGGAVGIATGAAVSSAGAPGLAPIAALAAGFISHFVCDSLPHWDHPNAPRINGELMWTRAVWIFAFTDSIIGGISTFMIWGWVFDFNILAPFLWGAGGGYLPDFLDNVPFWNKKLRKIPVFRKFHEFHEWIHSNWEWRFPMPTHWKLGLATQLMIGVPCLFYLFG